MLRVLQICKASVVSTVVSVFAVAAVGTEPRAATSAPQKAPASTTKVTSFGRLPLTFEKNTGRYDKRVQFLTRTGGATVFVTANEMVMVLPAKAREKLRAESGEPRAATPRVPSPRLRGEGQGEGYRLLSALASQPSAVLRMKLVGANAKAGATGLEKQPGIVNYFIGNDPKKWRTRVPTYAKAKLAGVYPGIDLVYYGVSGERREVSGKAVATRHSPLATHLEYDFIIKPGADPRRIQLAFEGADRIRVADGDLILSTPAGDVRMKRPYAYQTIAGKRVQVAPGRLRLQAQRPTGGPATGAVRRHKAAGGGPGSGVLDVLGREWTRPSRVEGRAGCRQLRECMGGRPNLLR
ncbi:MAG: hypothetical protein FJX72_17810 [Armatimonadetes bacterium]|nr:hypothetical protein [Armatimonadota bacterium]